MQLYYKKIEGGNNNLIILHGLLGSSDNWQSIAKQLNTDYTIYLLDQRNHGRSPHSNPMNYDLMADDIIEFIIENNLKNVTILGHSMGGKVAMTCALNNQEFINQIIVVDIAPKKYNGGHETILQAMNNAPLHLSNERKFLEQYFETQIPNATERQFILKNLTRNEHNNFIWKCNLKSITDNYQTLMDFPIINNVFTNKVYFIKGELSNYMQDNDKFAIEHLFPNYNIHTISKAGHWTHADNPTEFINYVNILL